MKPSAAHRHKRLEAKAARRRSRLAHGRKAFTQDELIAIKGEGVERAQRMFDRLPASSGQAKRRAGTSIAEVLRKVLAP